MSCLDDVRIGAVADGCGAAGDLAHVEECGLCAEQVEAVRSLGAALRALPMAAEKAPAPLRGTLRGLSAGARSERRRWFVGALAALAAAAALVIAPGGNGISEAFADEAVIRHLQAFAQGDGSGCHVTSGDPAHLATWLGDHLGKEVAVPLAEGVELVGARRCSLFGETAGAVVYRAGERAVTLFVPTPGSAAERACAKAVGECRTTRSGQTVCVVDGGQGPRVVVGELPAETLCSVAQGS